MEIGNGHATTWSNSGQINPWLAQSPGTTARQCCKHTTAHTTTHVQNPWRQIPHELWAVPVPALQQWARIFTSHWGSLSQAGKGREGKQPCQASSDSAMTLIFQACWWQLCEGWNLSNAGHTAIVLSGCTGVRLWRLLYVQGPQLSPKHSLERPSGKGRRRCRKHGGFVEWKVS